MRAVLLASATAATFGERCDWIVCNHGENLPPLRAWRWTVVAPKMSKVRKVGLPIFEIRPRRSCLRCHERAVSDQAKLRSAGRRRIHSD